MLNFNSYPQITEISIPHSVKHNGNFLNKFYGMTNLVTSKIPRNITNAMSIYYNCYNLLGTPICGKDVEDLSWSYYNCQNLTGSPVCGENVVRMDAAYENCRNLTGSPVCGSNVQYMSMTYRNCVNLTGSPVCMRNVKVLGSTYRGCINLTGSPVCGANVTNMASAYQGCSNLKGSPVCGNNVKNMSFTYYNCCNLTGNPICGENVTNMWNTYYNCRKLATNGYFYSDKITNAASCFGEKNPSKHLNLYVPENSTTLNTCLYNNANSLVGSAITWTNDMAMNSRYYNAAHNIYIYPVTNVDSVRTKNRD